MSHSHGLVPVFLVAAITWTGIASAAPPVSSSFFAELDAAGERVISELKQLGVRRVGVLKFSVQRGDEPSTDNAGAFNSLAAKRLHGAMVIANRRHEPSLTIAHDASQTAALVPGGSHRSDAGRRLLFKTLYPGDDGPMELEALLTARVELSRDRRTVSCYPLVVHANGKVNALEPFEARADAALLHELGYSYQRLRRGGPSPALAEHAVSIQEEYPLANGPAVSWKMYYDGRPVQVEFMGNRAVVAEPHPGQEITMTLESVDGSTQTLGVVLKVNGKNTIEHEQFPSAECSKWVLNQTIRKIRIPGFQRGMEFADAFTVKVPAQLRPDEVDYGDDLGAITLAVYQVADQNTINSAGGIQTRGLIVAGDRKVSRPIRHVKHVWEPQPIMSAVVWYYQR